MYPDWDGGKEEGIVGEVEDSKGGEAVRKKKKKVWRKKMRRKEKGREEEEAGWLQDREG